MIGELPNLLGPGMTGQMTYYSTSRGAQVFSAGAFSLAGSIRQKPVAQLSRTSGPVRGTPVDGAVARDAH